MDEEHINYPPEPLVPIYQPGPVHHPLGPTQQPPGPSQHPLDQNQYTPGHIQHPPLENGDLEAPISDSAPSTSALMATPPKEEVSPPTADENKLPSPRVKVATPKRPKPSK